MSLFIDGCSLPFTGSYDTLLNGIIGLNFSIFFEAFTSVGEAEVKIDTVTYSEITTLHVLV